MWVHYPILFLILHTFILWLLTFFLRVSALKSGNITITNLLYLQKSQFPSMTTLAGNSYDNQFQQPVLFIVLLALIHQQGIEGHFWYLVSTFFVIARYWHSFEHIACRNLLLRTLAFLLASACFFIAWLTYLTMHIMPSI